MEFIHLAGTLYIFYNAYIGKPKKFFTKIFCIIFGFMFGLVVVVLIMKNDWKNACFHSVNLTITIATPFIAKKLEKR